MSLCLWHILLILRYYNFHGTLFITGNRISLRRLSLCYQILKLDIDLPEIQEIDTTKIIETKLLVALKYREGEFIVEDTSPYLDCLNGLPGSLIKWFLKTINSEGLFRIASHFGNFKAEAKTIIRHVCGASEIYFFGAYKR